MDSNDQQASPKTDVDAPNKKEGKAGYVQFLVLCWACAMLTANYAGWMEKMDPTYIASILSGTLASAFSISREKKS